MSASSHLKIAILVCLLSVTASLNAEDFQVGGDAYLCFSNTLHPNWPEVFAIKVKIVELMERRVKVEVVDHYPGEGRVNEEQTPVVGDVMKISSARVYSRRQAGVQPGVRFHGKPVCSKLMGGAP